MTDVIMPQMGESIAEGTVTKWLKNVGDKVQRDEPLFEISTDKVDAEIPAPASGVLMEIRVQPGATVAINTVVGVIAAEGEAVAAASPAPPAPAPQAPAPPPPTPPPPSPPPVAAPPPVPMPPPAPQAAPAPPPAPPQPPAPPAVPPGSAAPPPRAPQADGTPAAAPPPSTRPMAPPPPPPVFAPPPPAAAAPAPPPPPGGETARSDMTADELRQTRSSPVVRRIAAEHNVDIREVPGTGIAGRVTKQDILGHIEGKPAPAAAPARPAAPAAPPAAAPAPPAPSAPAAPAPGPVAAPAAPAPRPAPPAVPGAAAAAPAATAVPPASPAGPPAAPFVPAFQPGERVEVVPMSPIRKKTAEHMVLSRRISAHVTTVFEMDLTRVDQLRQKYKQAYEERSGVKLTYMAFILKACIDALKAFPIVNASVDGDNIVYKKDVNIGMAVALEWGLIVPVIRNADEKNVLGLARAVADLAERARNKRLRVDEVQGGTFTVTNPGVFGSLFGTPIINQPQVAILGIGTIEKRPVVRDDAIAIRTMSCFALSFDHRIVDGADADRFMAHVKTSLQEFDEAAL